MPAVIAGKAKSIKLKTLKGLDTRPTAVRVKEAIFSSLDSYYLFDWSALMVLDLFAGSGQMAIEALSRGAARAVICDASPQARSVIFDNLTRTRLETSAQVHTVKAARLLARLASQEQRFDLVFIDPPYDRAREMWTELEPLLPPVLNPGAVLVLEQAAGQAFEPNVTELKQFRRCQYGTTVILFLEYSIMGV